MKHEHSYKLDFGQYKGLTIKEIYQGTLDINEQFVTEYLNLILNTILKDNNFIEFEFIDRIEVEKNIIKIFGDIHNPEKPLSPSNRISLGNIEQVLENYINQYFNPTFLGILKDLKKYNGEQKQKNILGGDPEYIKWCIETVRDFNISKECKKYLHNLSIARLIGIQIIYIGNEKYTYQLKFEIERPKIEYFK